VIALTFLLIDVTILYYTRDILQKKIAKIQKY